MDNETLKKIKVVIIGLRLAGTVISRKMVVAIGTSVVKVNELKILREFGGSLDLTEGWTRNILKGIYWVERKGMTGKDEPCPKFLEGGKFTFQCAISKFVSDDDIPLELLLNLDQIPLSYVSSRKCTSKVQKQFQSKVVNDKRQITVTFTVTASDPFLSTQLVYSGKTSVVYPSMISLVPLMLRSLQIIGLILKNESYCSRKLSFPTINLRKKSLVTQRSSTY